jgi:L-amino acid N-acyltransferase YncA
MTPLTRPARAEDAAIVLGIRDEAIRSSSGLWIDEVPAEESSRAWFDSQLDRGSMLVAEQQGEVLGYACFSPLRDYAGYRFTAENSIYLLPAAQGRGVGTILLSALIAHAREHGMHSLVALIEAGNTGSLRLHERSGFREVGRMPEAGFKFDRWWDLVTLQLLL